MKFKRDSTNYHLPLSVNQWDKLEERCKNILDKDWIDPFKDTEAIGVYDLNWSGHFGRNLFFRVEYENEKAVLNKFKLWIKKYLGG